jgi:hypothetical protein
MSAPVSIEDRRLLNPAFSGILLIRASQGFWKQSQNGIPFIYAYLVLPLLLHPETRERLPSAVVTKLVTWTERNGDLVALIPRRISELASATRDGLFVATASGLAHLGPAGQIEPILKENDLTSFEKKTASSEIAGCMRKAHFIGRWFATSGTVPTVLTALGVRL